MTFYSTISRQFICQTIWQRNSIGHFNNVNIIKKISKRLMNNSKNK
jgi:hypothetical protein